MTDEEWFQKLKTEGKIEYPVMGGTLRVTYRYVRARPYFHKIDTYIETDDKKIIDIKEWRSSYPNIEIIRFRISQEIEKRKIPIDIGEVYRDIKDGHEIVVVEIMDGMVKYQYKESTQTDVLSIDDFMLCYEHEKAYILESRLNDNTWWRSLVIADG